MTTLPRTEATTSPRKRRLNRENRRPITPPTAQPILSELVDVIDFPSDDLNTLFGREIAPQLLAAMANAPYQTRAEVRVTIEGDDVIQTLTRFHGGNATRMFFRHDVNNSVVVENWEFRLRWVLDESTGEWVRENPDIDGAELFVNQVRALRSVGATQIQAPASRKDDPDPNKELVGYFVWPKLGFDAYIPNEIWPKLPGNLQSQVETNEIGSPHPRSILSLVRTKEGEQWWTEHGDGLDECVFDLKADSVCMKALARYLEPRMVVEN